MMNRMTGKPNQPEGYCPNCGSRMDAGACPECEREASESQLAMKPPVWWRRWRVRVNVLYLVVFAVGLREGYIRGLHVKWIPVSILIGMDVPRSEWAVAELFRRFTSDELSSDEESALLASVLTTSLKMQSRFPANVPFPVDAVMEMDFPQSGALYLDDPKLSVDGAPGSIVEEGDGAYRIPCAKIRGFQTRIVLKGLEPGTHLISISGAVVLHPNGQRAQENLPRLKFHETREVLIEDWPAHEFVRPVYDEVLAKDMRRAASVQISRGKRDGYSNLNLRLSFDRSPVTLYFDLYLRLSGTSEYKMLDSQMFNGTLSAVSFSRGGFFPEAGETGFMDVKLVPNATAALREGLTEYFNGVLEWHAVPFRPEKTSPDSADAFHPTVVRAVTEGEK